MAAYVEGIAQFSGSAGSIFINGNFQLLRIEFLEHPALCSPLVFQAEVILFETTCRRPPSAGLFIHNTMLQLSKTLSPNGESKSKLESQKGDAEMATLILALHESSSLWIDTAIQRSGLSQAILHSLATFTEISQITENMSQFEEGESLPLCMRLLRPNYSKEGSSILWVLLQITNDLLQLTEPHFESQTKPSVVSIPVNNGRGSRNSPPTETVKTRTNDTPSQQSAQIYPGILPWCTSTSTIDIATLKTLASRKFSSPFLALIASCYAGGSSPVCRTRPRHIATQLLLLNTVRVALSPTARIDLHPLWFAFLRKTLVHWGSATALLINTVVTQMSVAIQLLAEPFCHALMPAGLTERFPPSAYPPDYTILLFACLQGIVHTFLLPFGLSKSTLMRGMMLGTTTLARDGPPLVSSTNYSPAHRGKQDNNSFSYSSTNGEVFVETKLTSVDCRLYDEAEMIYRKWTKSICPLRNQVIVECSKKVYVMSNEMDRLSSGVFDTPETLRDSLQVAKALEDFHSLNQLFEFSSVGQALQRMQLAFLEDPAIPSTLTGSLALLFAVRMTVNALSV
ncbi:hypothetical protein ACTXT7_011481 [Hymenolepis weldensis]